MKKGILMNYIVPASVIVGIYFLLHIVGIGCPIRFLTGISCAGCGMTRAWLSVGKMDFESAFYYHPLFFVPLIWLLGFCMRNRIGAMTKKTFIAVTVILFIYSSAGKYSTVINFIGFIITFSFW